MGAVYRTKFTDTKEICNSAKMGEEGMKANLSCKSKQIHLLWEKGKEEGGAEKANNVH